MLLLYALAKNFEFIFTAVSIRAASAIAICFSKKTLSLFPCRAVSIRAANAIAICFSKKHTFLLLVLCTRL